MSLYSLEALKVAARIQRGSSSPIIVETEAGRFVTKLRGAGHGVLALVAELIVAELAEAIGLPVPSRALIALPAEIPSDDRNDELRDLLTRSIGINVGFRELEKAIDPRPEAIRGLDDGFAARVLWLDGLVMNLDRTPANPNILIWKNQPWLIDHGSALPFHHDWASVSEASPREPWSPTTHLFADRAQHLRGVDTELALRLDRAQLSAATAVVPDAFLAETVPDATPDRARAMYEAFLWKRLKAPRSFVFPDRGGRPNPFFSE